jgi:hypothetical protein
MRSWKSILFILNPHGFTSAHVAIFHADYLPDIGISGIGFTDLSHMKCVNGQSIKVRWMSDGKVICLLSQVQLDLMSYLNAAIYPESEGTIHLSKFRGRQLTKMVATL